MLRCCPLPLNLSGSKPSEGKGEARLFANTGELAHGLADVIVEAAAVSHTDYTREIIPDDMQSF